MIATFHGSWNVGIKPVAFTVSPSCRLLTQFAALQYLNTFLYTSMENQRLYHDRHHGSVWIRPCSSVAEICCNLLSSFVHLQILQCRTPAQRLFIMKSFFGHVPDLVKHTVAMDVVEYAYNEYANALQRCQLASEFYGNEFQIFKVFFVISS